MRLSRLRGSAAEGFPSSRFHLKNRKPSAKGWSGSTTWSSWPAARARWHHATCYAMSRQRAPSAVPSAAPSAVPVSAPRQRPVPFGGPRHRASSAPGPLQRVPSARPVSARPPSAVPVSAHHQRP
eukprot:7050577-Pyramimonas_sp.AAC.1